MLSIVLTTSVGGVVMAIENRARNVVNPFPTLVPSEGTRIYTSSPLGPRGPGRRPPDHRSRGWGRARGPRAVWSRSRLSDFRRSLPSAPRTLRYARDTGGHEGMSVSVPVGLVPRLVKRLRPSGCIVEVIPVLSR